MKHSLKFTSVEELRQWFKNNHTTSPGLWIRFENGSQFASVSPEDALKVALSYGWLDDRIKRISDTSYRRKFIPRRDGSIWTDEEKATVAELTELGLMDKAGLDAVVRAKSDGSWNSSQGSPVTDAMLETFSSALRQYEPAFSNFLRLSPSSQRTYAVNYCAAKRPETRSRRLAAAVKKLNAEPVLKSGAQRSGK